MYAIRSYYVGRPVERPEVPGQEVAVLVRHRDHREVGRVAGAEPVRDAVLEAGRAVQEGLDQASVPLEPSPPEGLAARHARQRVAAGPPVGVLSYNFV